MSCQIKTIISQQENQFWDISILDQMKIRYINTYLDGRLSSKFGLSRVGVELHTVQNTKPKNNNSVGLNLRP